MIILFTTFLITEFTILRKLNIHSVSTINKVFGINTFNTALSFNIYSVQIQIFPINKKQ